MNADRARQLDQAAGQAITRAARPLLPWAGALYVAGGSAGLTWVTGHDATMTAITGALGTLLAALVLPHWRRAARRVDPTGAGK